MKVLTRELIDAELPWLVTAEDLANWLESEGYLDPPKFRISKDKLLDYLKMDTRVRTEIVSPYLLRRLVAAGYLERRQDELHTLPGRKPYLYEVTEKGKKFIDRHDNPKATNTKKTEETVEES